MKKISVIIPCYNSEKTIIRTLDSIKKQSYSNFEVLIINDGSIDNSLRLIKEYCNNDKRFFVYDIENGGVSNARNIGLNHASGDYVIFIDSDDYVKDDYFSSIVNDIKDYDMIVYSFETWKNGNLKDICCDEDIDNNINKIDFCRKLTNSKLFANSTNKVFLRSKIGNIRFDTTTNLGEDYEFVMHYFININTYKYYNKSFYTYDLTTGNLGFKNKKNTYELKSKGNFRKMELYEKYNYSLEEVYNEFVKAFVIDMMNLMIYQNGNKKDMMNNQKHCMEVFDLRNIKLSFKNYILVRIFNCKIYFIVKLFSYLVDIANKLVKRIKYGY